MPERKSETNLALGLLKANCCLPEAHGIVFLSLKFKIFGRDLSSLFELISSSCFLTFGSFIRLGFFFLFYVSPKDKILNWLLSF